MAQRQYAIHSSAGSQNLCQPTTCSLLYYVKHTKMDQSENDSRYGGRYRHMSHVVISNAFISVAHGTLKMTQAMVDDIGICPML